MAEEFYRCTACRRCKVDCPMGVDHGLITRLGRWILAEIGITPKALVVATREQRRSFKHVAVQLELDDDGVPDTVAVQSFLEQYFQDAEINVFWGSVQQFVAELREQWEASGR